MDVLKQKLNDIGSCIGYPFYFFEDGSFSHTFVCGKMNACLVVKGAFAESDKCFFASSEVASISGIKAMEKSWTQESVVSQNVNWFKKYLNDIGSVLNYPFYVFDDGTYNKTSSVGGKQAILIVKKPFTSVEGESTFFSTDSRKVLQFNEDLKKLKKQQNERKDIVFRMLAGEQVSDQEALLVIENEPHDVVKRCVHSVWEKIGCYSNKVRSYLKIVETYPKSFEALVKKNWWDIYCFDEQELMYFCLCEAKCEPFLSLVFQYATPEILEKILRLCLKGNFSAEILKNHGWKHWLEREWADFSQMRMGEFRRDTVKCFKPLYLIERGDTDAYKIYRKYMCRDYWICRNYGFKDYRYHAESLDLHFDEEFDAIVALGDRDLFKILFDGISLSTEQKAKLIRTGNIEMIRTYVECCGIDGKFRELLLYSGNDGLVQLANNPKENLQATSQEKNVSDVSSGWLQKVKKFFGISA